MTKPCEMACPKCGGVDIHREFYEKGDEVSRPYGEVTGKTTEFVRRKEYDWQAKKDCIVHHCRTCQYEWDGAPLNAEPGLTIDQVVDQIRDKHS